ncbi:hypothetical protein JCM10212_006959 [Sporobolomyces blumeae]
MLLSTLCSLALAGTGALSSPCGVPSPVELTDSSFFNASAALAVPVPAPVPTPAPDLFHDAFERDLAAPIRAYLLTKRQTSSDDNAAQVVLDYQEFLYRAARAVASGSGSCTSQCSAWVGSVRPDVVDEMRECGQCYGQDEVSTTEDFRGVCQRELASLSSAGSSIGTVGSTSSNVATGFPYPTNDPVGTGTGTTTAPQATSPADNQGTSGAGKLGWTVGGTFGVALAMAFLS